MNTLLGPLLTSQSVKAESFEMVSPGSGDGVAGQTGLVRSEAASCLNCCLHTHFLSHGVAQKCALIGRKNLNRQGNENHP